MPFYVAARSIDLLSILVILALVAAVPLLQFASLGYLLVAGSRLADGRSWRHCLPGHRLAGRLGVFSLIALLLLLPVMLVEDLAYSARVLDPGSRMAARWALGALLIAGCWVVHVGWAAMRGGRWWHLLWPAPLKFIKQIWRPSLWSGASDRLYDLVVQLQFPKLWWLGARATVGALLWLFLPVSMMIIGQRSSLEVAPLVGLLGALLMVWIMFYLPFLQIKFAQTGNFRSFFSIGELRKSYAYAPWAHLLGLVALSTLSIPLYLLRIENPPDELLWIPSIIFALMMLPSKLLLGWAVGYASRRKSRNLQRRSWWVRWPAYLLSLAPIAAYVGALYIAQLIAGQGAFVMYFQHAFLVPNPLSIFGHLMLV